MAKVHGPSLSQAWEQGCDGYEVHNTFNGHLQLWVLGDIYVCTCVSLEMSVCTVRNPKQEESIQLNTIVWNGDGAMAVIFIWILARYDTLVREYNKFEHSSNSA